MKRFTPVNYDDLTRSKSITIKDIENMHKQTVVNEFLETRITNPFIKVEEISEDIGISMSTLTRYKKSLGYKPRSRRPLSTEQKESMIAKSLATKAKNLEAHSQNQETRSKLKIKQDEIKAGRLLRKAHEVRETNRAGTLFPHDQKNISADVSADEIRNQNILLKLQKADGQLNQPKVS